ncbi:hypothetical protein [Flavobacterium sp.]|jgi:integrase/recombinase XerD
MNWSAKIITHKKVKRIAVYFEKNADLIARTCLPAGRSKKLMEPDGVNP